MGDTFRVLVTGSRTWGDSIKIRTELDAAFDGRLRSPGGLEVPMVLVHGACPSGADAIAAAWCRDRALGMPWYYREEPHPADWETHRKRAGFKRNEEMVALGADVCLAFIMPCASPSCRNRKLHGTHGASHCAALAVRAAIEVRQFCPERVNG